MITKTGIKINKTNVIQLTLEGVQKKKNRLKKLLQVERPKILKELSEARSQGDLSENADYDAAKEKQAQIEAEISEIELILSKASIIEKNSSKKISLGSVVTYQRKDNNTINKIRLVSSLEVDPTSKIPSIGSNSPLGSSLIGSETGNILTIESTKKYDIIIKKVE